MASIGGRAPPGQNTRSPYHPVWTAGVTSTKDFVFAAVAFLLLYMWQITPWLVVILCAGGAGVVALMPSWAF
jgi:hypothetical protein